MIKFRWAKRLMQDAEKIEEWLTGDSMSDPNPAPSNSYPTNNKVNERIEELEEKINEISEDNKRLKKMLLKSSVDMANLESIIKTAIIGQAQIITDIRTIYSFLKRIEDETGSSKFDVDWEYAESTDDEDDDGEEGGGSGGLLN
mgnify:CR=1 FL=1